MWRKKRVNSQVSGQEKRASLAVIPKVQRHSKMKMSLNHSYLCLSSLGRMLFDRGKGWW